MRVVRGNFAAPRATVPARRVSRIPYRYPLSLALPSTPGSLINSGQSACLLNSSFAGSSYCRQFYSGRSGWGIQPVVAPYWFPSTAEYDSEPLPAASAEEPESQLAAQVGNLAEEVERMREDQTARDAAPPPTRSPVSRVEESPVKTLLVYRDGRRVEVQNYAILGPSLWVFTGQGSRQVALSDLDLAATKQSNEERGIDFLPQH